MSGIDARELLVRIGQRVRAARSKRGWTMRETAARAGLSPRFFAELEAGRGNIAIGRLAAVANALELPLDQLVRDGAAGPARRAVERLVVGAPEARLAAVLPQLDSWLGRGRRDGIALLGLRGAGKSALGAGVARSLDLPFVELNDRIEEAAGLRLTELFEMHGEPYYRRLSRSCLRELLDEAPALVALPGGIVRDDEAAALVWQRCTTVWLRADPEDHMQRLLDQGDARPMAGRADAMAELRAILAAREPFYAQADLTVDTSGRTPAQAEAALREGLQAHGWSGRGP